MELLSRTVRVEHAEAEAAALRGPSNRRVTVEPIDDDLAQGVKIARVVVSSRRPHLRELCMEDRLHRQALVTRLEAACRHEAGATTLGDLPKWRRRIRAGLMSGEMPKEIADAEPTAA